jgi:hypothetical protein
MGVNIMDRRVYLGVCAGVLGGLAGCSGDTDSDGVPQETTDTPTATSGSSGSRSTPTRADEPATETQAETPTEESTRTRQVGEAVIGEVVQDDTLGMAVSGMEKTEGVGQFQEADPGNTFVVVDLGIKNRTSGEFIDFSGLLQTRLKDSEDYTYDQTVATTGNTFRGGQIAPGEVSRGDVVYEVPRDASGLTMQFDFEAFALFDFSRVEVDLSENAGDPTTLKQNLQVEPYGTGDTVEFQDVQVALNSVETTTELGSFTQAKEGNEFLIADVTTTNNTDEELSISTILQMFVKDGQGFSYVPSITAISALDQAYSQGSPLAPSETRRGKVAYEVPTGTSPLYWIFEFSLWVDGSKTFWQVR